MKHFYSHLINLEILFLELDDLNLSVHERKHLGLLIDSNLHHTILEVVLSQLNEGEKETFLRLVSQNKHDTIWEHLQKRVDQIEIKIKKAAEEITSSMHQDILDAKRLKGKIR